ncbi:AAA family ATPase [Pleomorphomonas sp. PLEO]|uniref:AAA family ATPase n=1 Tax=Pleomorphomonas sp. PLEO TaxID=3239306 RepID=UPI00351E28E8
MLEELKIVRFKSIREMSLNFGAINLFIGGNGSGKSNILEAIGLVSACLGRGLSGPDIGSKGLRITPPELMKSSFKNDVLPKTLELTAKFSGEITYKSVLQSRVSDPLLRFFSEASYISDQRIFGRSNRGASATGVSHADRLDKGRGIWDQIKATYDIPADMDSAFSQFSRFVIYSPQTDFLRGRQSGRVDMPPIGLHGEGLSEAVSSFLSVWRRYSAKPLKDSSRETVEWQILQKCVQLVWLPGWASQFGAHRPPPNLTSRDVADVSKDIVYFVDRFMHAARNRLSVYDSSEGTLFLLFVAIILSHPDSPKIFALDNVDNALNPRLTRKLVEAIVGVVSMANADGASLGARQVFLTSHNPTALDAFDLFDEKHRVFVVRRNEKGHTTADRLCPSKGATREDWQRMMKGRNLSQIWLDGDIPGALGDL